MSEYVVDFGDKSSAFVGLAMAEAESHGATLKERVVRCRDCKHYEPNTYSHFTCKLLTFHVEPDGFCAWGERKADHD